MVFSSARGWGRKAANIGLPPSENPYRDLQARAAWIGGYSEGLASRMDTEQVSRKLDESIASAFV